ncbi:hypothetical protein BDV98DRAFT_569780, partial [Pterulicium gracile]
ETRKLLSALAAYQQRRQSTSAFVSIGQGCASSIGYAHLCPAELADPGPDEAQLPEHDALSDHCQLPSLSPSPHYSCLLDVCFRAARPSSSAC